MAVVIPVGEEQHGVPQVFFNGQHGHLLIFMHRSPGREQAAAHFRFHI